MPRAVDGTVIAAPLCGCKAPCRIVYTTPARKPLSLPSIEDSLFSTEDGFMLPRFKAAAVHAAPVFLDKLQTTKKALSQNREATDATLAPSSPTER